MYWIDLPDAIAMRVSEWPFTQQAARFERALNLALDAAGAPRVIEKRGATERDHVLVSGWYVNIWNRDGTLRGHVGPITESEHKAVTVAKSWQSTGLRARHSTRALGEALTNA